MKKNKLFIILLITVLLLTGCAAKEEKQLNKSIKSTSITQKGLNSYRCKVSITQKENMINYVVLNKENNEYDISVSTEEGDYSYSIRDDSKDESHAPISRENSEISIPYYDYTDTDRFLEVLKDTTSIKVSNEKIGDVDYKKYEFKISKKNLNKILEDFSIKVKKDGTGYAYVDSEKHVYMVNYISGDVSINASYTRLDGVK